MTTIEITTAVDLLERVIVPTDSGTISRAIGEPEHVVRRAIFAAIAAGYVHRVYRRDLPPGRRDTYVTTYAGQKAVKDMVTA